MSNFYPCEFTDDEEYNNSGYRIVFKNMEQYFMYQKANMFDKTAIPSILSETDPKKIKKLGLSIKDFKDEEWNKEKLDIMYKGLQLKFGQNNDILKKLLETGNKTLYEANKYDPYWGIFCDVETGIQIENSSNSVLDDNGNPIVFRDNNLGKLLMKLRDWFRKNPPK